MNRRRNTLDRNGVLAFALFALAGCGGEDGVTDDSRVDVPPPAVTDRIPVPPDVRRNLGIEFVPVERRHVARLLRLPGIFEWMPTSQQQVHANFGGRLTLLVRQFQRVEAGDLLATLDSPAWRSEQAKLTQAESEILRLRRRLAALVPLLDDRRAHLRAVEDAERLTAADVERVRKLHETVGGQASELALALERLARARADVAEVKEELDETELQRVQDDGQLEGHRRQSPRFWESVTGEASAAFAGADLLLAPVASQLGTTVDALLQTVEIDGHRLPRWRVLEVVELRAMRSGVVQEVDATDGDWLENGARVLTIVDPTRVRFHADALQGDLAKLRDGMAGSVVPPRGVASEAGARLDVTVSLGWEAVSHSRVVSLYAMPEEVASWVKPGVAASLELVVEGTETAQLAVPLSCLTRDGIERFLFRRDPKDRDKVIRVPADLGIDDGRWVVVKSGFMDGDEVVREGAYELGISGLGKAPSGGHFHADGTWHAEAD